MSAPAASLNVAVPAGDAAALADVVAGLGARAIPVAGGPGAALAAAEGGRADAAALVCDCASPGDGGSLAAVARALWEADLFIVREMALPGATSARALILAREPAPAGRPLCAVGGVAPAAAAPAIREVFAREGLLPRDFFSFPEFAAPHSGRLNYFVVFPATLRNLPEQRALSAFEGLVEGYRFLGNF